MDREQLDKALYAAVALLILGAIGPWVTAFGISKAGTSGDGVLTLGAALLALAAIRLGGRPTIALILAVLIDAIVIYDFLDVSGSDLVGVGWGLYMSIVGAALLTYVSIQLRRLGQDAVPAG